MNFNNKQIKNFIKILKKELTLINEIFINHFINVIFTQN